MSRRTPLSRTLRTTSLLVLVCGCLVPPAENGWALAPLAAATAVLWHVLSARGAERERRRRGRITSSRAWPAAVLVAVALAAIVQTVVGMPDAPASSDLADAVMRRPVPLVAAMAAIWTCIRICAMLPARRRDVRSDYFG